MNEAPSRQDVHYCFISYKHRDHNKFVIDAKWADELVPALARMKIKMPPLEESQVISPATHKEEGNFVDRVFKDTYNLNSGEYAKIIDNALNCSRKLVLIVSWDMILDQNTRVKDAINTGNDDYLQDAWCYREIREFMRTHTFEDIIPIVVEKRPFDDSLIGTPANFRV